MKKLLSILLLVILVGIFFKQFFLQNLLPIPADNIIGLYHPFRDLYATTNPRGIPYKNFLISDPVEQQYPWKFLAISLEKQRQLPLWNPYSFSGMPLLGNLQSSALYPLNFVFFLMPFPYSWAFLIILQPILASIFMYFYLRNLKLSVVSSVFGGFIFAFSAFSILWLEWGTIVQTGLWLPLLLLAVDKICLPNSKSLFAWSVLFVFALASAFLAGHLQTFFYLSFVLFFYYIARLIQYSKQWRKIFLFSVLVITCIVITSIQWIPLMQLIALSARDIDHVSYLTPGWFVPWQHLVQFIAPDFFGNPTTLNYWGTWNYGELTGYIGLAPLLFALFALLFVRAKKVYFFGAILLVSLLFVLPTPLATLPFVFNIPFLSTAQPTRLIFAIDFALSILAAIGFASLQTLSKKIWIVVGLFVAALGCLWGFVYVGQRFGTLQENLVVTKQNLIFPSGILFAMIAILILFIFLKKRKYTAIIVSLVFIGLTVIDLFRFGYKFTPFNPSAYLYPPTKSITFLKEHIGDRRLMETDRQILAPNFSIMYSLQSIDGYDPLYLKRYGEYIAASERGKADVHTPFGFNRIITPQRVDSRLINLLGVKYVLSLTDLQSPTLKKVFEEGQTKVYENVSALPRAFFVKSIVAAAAKQQSMDYLFDKKIDLSQTAIVEREVISRTYEIGKAVITSYKPNEVIIKTQNKSQGFLLFTDIYYPTWHATIDGQKTHIFLTDYLFRGVIVPKGNHVVIFTNTVF